MKKHTVSSWFIALLFLASSMRMFAHPGEHGDQPKLPETVPAIVAALDSQQQSLAKAVDEGKLPRVAPHARTINLLVKQLAAKASDHHQSKLKTMAVEHDKLTSELIKASSGGTQGDVAALVAKVAASIDAMKAEAH